MMGFWGREGGETDPEAAPPSPQKSDWVRRRSGQKDSRGDSLRGRRGRGGGDQCGRRQHRAGGGVGRPVGLEDEWCEGSAPRGPLAADFLGISIAIEIQVQGIRAQRICFAETRQEKATMHVGCARRVIRRGSRRSRCGAHPGVRCSRVPGRLRLISTVEGTGCTGLFWGRWGECVVCYLGQLNMQLQL